MKRTIIVTIDVEPYDNGRKVMETIENMVFENAYKVVEEINVLEVAFEKNVDCVVSELSGTRCESCCGGKCEVGEFIDYELS